MSESPKDRAHLPSKIGYFTRNSVFGDFNVSCECKHDLWPFQSVFSDSSELHEHFLLLYFVFIFYLLLFSITLMCTVAGLL